MSINTGTWVKVCLASDVGKLYRFFSVTSNISRWQLSRNSTGYNVAVLTTEPSVK